MAERSASVDPHHRYLYQLYGVPEGHDGPHDPPLAHERHLRAPEHLRRSRICPGCLAGRGGGA